MIPARFRILGVMTGTSCDGLDAACIEVDEHKWVPLWNARREFPTSLRKRVFAFQEPGSRHSAIEWLKLHRDLGEWFATSLAAEIKKQRKKPEIIANHGQTMAHLPHAKNGGMTLQMGDSTRIVHSTGLTVVSGFREGDVAVGGQGAPLTPLFHRALALALHPENPGVSIHNLGGISNFTYIGPHGKVIALDTGPGNLWLDATSRLASAGHSPMDLNGKLSSSGKADMECVKTVLNHPYFKKSIPKSTGRDDFPISYLLERTKTKGASLVATAAQVTIESILAAYHRWIFKPKLPLKYIYLCGGGAKNPTLLNGLQKGLPDVQVATLDMKGIDSQFVEAQAFAYLGFLALKGIPSGGSWTGAKGFAAPAHIFPGKNWNSLIQKLI